MFTASSGSAFAACTTIPSLSSSGDVDLGEFAASRLGALGNAGGHRALARAEFPLEATEGRSVDVFVFRKLTEKPQKKKVEDVESVEAGEEE